MRLLVLPLQSSLLVRRFLIFTSPAKFKSNSKSKSKSKSRPRPGIVPATSQQDASSNSEEGESNKPIASTGKGFGRPKSNPGAETTSNKKRGSVVRRSPVETPSFLDKEDGAVGKEPPLTESAFLLTWLGLGAIILVQGLLVAASGFLPEQWDNYFVKYLYPSFTPTVALFVAGTSTYGLIKYFQNENTKTSK